MQSELLDEYAAELARQVSSYTGESLPETVIHALEAMLEKVREYARDMEKALAVERHCASLPDLDPRSPDEILGYDDQGLLR